MNNLHPEQPCKHRGCRNHVHQPCEGCGRMWSQAPFVPRSEHLAATREHERKLNAIRGVLVGYNDGPHGGPNIADADDFLDWIEKIVADDEHHIEEGLRVLRGEDKCSETQ